MLKIRVQLARVVISNALICSWLCHSYDDWPLAVVYMHVCTKEGWWLPHLRAQNFQLHYCTKTKVQAKAEIKLIGCCSEAAYLAMFETARTPKHSLWCSEGKSTSVQLPNNSSHYHHHPFPFASFLIGWNSMCPVKQQCPNISIIIIIILVRLLHPLLLSFTTMPVSLGRLHLLRPLLLY